ncbi:hypothetical protein ACEN8K_09260 [Variovorax sp. CT11-76]
MWRAWSPAIGSIFTTSAPNSASTIAAPGPAMYCPMSITRTPESGAAGPVVSVVVSVFIGPDLIPFPYS